VKHVSNLSSRARVCVVGSRRLSGIPKELVTAMATVFPDQATVLLRHPLHRKPERFELMMEHACTVMGFEVDWRKPEPGGRQMVYFRDIEMVGAADVVLAYFADDEMSGGTEHVVDKAIDQRVPVYSFGIRDGKLVMLGSHDPDNVFGYYVI
jgi:hypothetical protein